jgi:hypothetical protein
MSEALYRLKQIAAIEAIAQDQLAEAHTIVLELLTEAEERRDVAVVRGQCRYCKCVEDHACGIVVFPGPEFPPTQIACSWLDDDQTVCTNLRCLERYRREYPQYTSAASGLVLP